MANSDKILFIHSYFVPWEKLRILYYLYIATNCFKVYSLISDVLCAINSVLTLKFGSSFRSFIQTQTPVTKVKLLHTVILISWYFTSTVYRHEFNSVDSFLHFAFALSQVRTKRNIYISCLL